MYLDTDGGKRRIYFHAGENRTTWLRLSIDVDITTGAAPVTSPRCFRVGDRHIRYPSLC
jgi:hypothetical protein